MQSNRPDGVAFGCRSKKTKAWCEGGDSNPYTARASGPKPGASTNFATLACVWELAILLHFVFVL